MPDRLLPDERDDRMSLRPPTVSAADKPLRQQVAMAYRTAREAGVSHHHALDAAEAAYFQAHPETLADRLAASAHTNEMIASAIRIDPKWFWKNVCAYAPRSYRAGTRFDRCHCGGLWLS
jgi:hypothetical protein